MRARKILRWTFTALSAAALVVIYLNIEKLAEANGLDELFVYLWGEVPGWVSWFTEAATSTASLVAALCLVAYTAGLWTEWLIRRVWNWANRPVDYIALAEKCDEFAEVLRVGADLFDLDSRKGYLMGIGFVPAFSSTQTKIEKEFGVDIDVMRITKARALRYADYLESLAAVLREEDLEQALALSDQFNRSEPHEPPVPEGTPAEKQP